MGTAYNIAYLASCLRYFAQIPLRGTSGTLGALHEIGAKGYESMKGILDTTKISIGGLGTTASYFLFLTSAFNSSLSLHCFLFQC